MFWRNTLFVTMTFLFLFGEGAPFRLTSPVAAQNKDISSENKAQKKKLVLESFQELGIALRLQHKCKILESSDAGALRYYAIQMRKFLNTSESLSAISKLNRKVQTEFKARLKAAGNDKVVLCSKETMSLLEDSLTSATLVNEMLGNKPFDAVADKHRIIVNMLKAASRLKGATRQCPKRMKEAGFASLASKLSMNTLVLSAMARMEGIDSAALKKIKQISQQTAKLPVWKKQCRVDVFQIQNNKMKKLIEKLRQ